MILLLYGPDSYRRQKNLNSVINSYQEKYSVFSIDYFTFDNESDFFKLKDFCGQTSLFDSKKLAVAKNFLTANKDLSKDIESFFKENLKSENTVLIIIEDAAPPKNFEFLLKESSNIYEFKNLTGVHLEFFIQKEAEKKKMNLAPDAVKFLAKIFANNTWGIITELEKLELLHSGQNKKITVAEIEKTITHFEEPNLFKFIDAASRNKNPNDKNIAQKLYFLENLFLNKEDGAKIFNILASRPFLDFEMLKNLADYDIFIKSGKLDYELALFDLILK